MSKRTKEERLRRNVAEGRMNAWKTLIMRDGCVPLFVVCAKTGENGEAQPAVYSLQQDRDILAMILRRMADHLEKTPKT